MMKYALMAVAAAGALAMASQASAGALSGSIWEGDTSGDASVVPSGAPTATFTPGAINYFAGDTFGLPYTIGAFLNGASMSAPIGGDSMDNVHIQITGTVGLQHGLNHFDITHDDGLVLNIAGFGNVVPGQNGPTAPVDTPFDIYNAGAAGNFAFTLDYNECCGSPAALSWQINDVTVGVPEPATWAMMILGVAGIGAAMRRRQALVAA